MAFNQNAQVEEGPPLEEIPAEERFLAVNKDNKIRLLKNKWPSNAEPSPTASLLSIASRRGLVAAAGPDALVIAKAETLRELLNKSQEASAIIEYDSPLSISLPMRISHVYFTSDEKYLAITAETGGGLAVYEVDSLLQGNKEPSFQIATNGTSVRAVAPNPEIGQYLLLVLSNGSLVLADLESKSLQNGKNGAVLCENVSCASWSVKGKQLIAGLGDGSVSQIKPDGDLVATIPKPPSLTGSVHVSGINWLANDEFLFIHTDSSGANGEQIFHFVRREKGTSNFLFQKLAADIVMPGFDRTEVAPSPFILRLRDFEPNLSSLLLVTTNRTTEITMLANATSPLIPSQPIVNTYTAINPPNEGRKAALPFGDDADTFPVGMALDLSATEKVRRPLPSELEYEESLTPLPAVTALNNEGMLMMWWIVNDESIKRGTGYRGLTALAGGQSATTQTAQPVQPAQSTPAPSSAFGKPSTPAFGAPAFGAPAFGAATFGTPSQISAFGGPALSKPSPWAQPAATTSSAAGAAFGKPGFGQPAFGSAAKIGAGTPGAATFGSAGGTTGSSPWGAQQNQNKPAFGTPSTPSGSGFSSFAGSGGFATVGQSGQSAFASGTSPFSAFSQKGTSFGTPSSSFGVKTEQSFGSTVTLDSSKGGSNAGNGGFSPFVNVSNSNTPANQQSAFGSTPQSSFASMSQESDMGDADDIASRGRSEATPTPQLPPPKEPPQKEPPKPTSGLFGGGSTFKLGSTFAGDGSAKDDLPKPPGGTSSFFGSNFGKSLDSDSNQTPVTPVKKEPVDEKLNLKDVSETPAAEPPQQKPGLFSFTSTQKAQDNQSATPQAAKPEAAPLPPDFTKSSATKAPAFDDVPLPPDFTKSSTPKAPVPESAPLPPDFTQPNSKKSTEDDLPPLAGSPPITVEPPSSDLGSVSVPEEENDDSFEVEEHDGSDEQDEASELEGVGQRSPARRASRPQPPGSNWSFQSSTQSHQPPPPAPSPPVQSRSPSRSPLRNQVYPTTTPLGLPKGPVFAPPASRTLESPRSPSPIRSASTPVFIKRESVPPAKAPPRPISRAKAPTPPDPEPVVEDLSDAEDARIREELEAPIEPTTTLDPFIVRLGSELNSKPGIPGQIERVYRDINAMVDTLGVNARTLACFIAGHTADSDRQRTRDDLDSITYEDTVDDWTLVECLELADLEDELDETLENGRVRNVQGKLAELANLHRGLNRLRARAKALDRSLRINATDSVAATNAPLSTEQSFQLRTLRNAVSDLQTLLRETEGAAVLLRARLAAAKGANSANGNGKPTQTPTVEAVTNTIAKMTAMIEKKSGDVDVLETQMRKLRMTAPESLSASSRSLERSKSREGTYALSFSDSDDDDDDDEPSAPNNRDTPSKRMPGAFATPQSHSHSHHRSSTRVAPPSSGRSVASVWHTPGSSFEQSPSSSSLSLLRGGGTSNSTTTTNGRGLAGISDEEVVVRAERVQRRKGLAQSFAQAIMRRGVRVREVGAP
ncbi:hypothetical protein EJ05DRAFT_500682 [Pseudovirgaria hyperparasitica]|uniref:Nucleoporin Nup159/Nup146 N-terminal domain-containing protein n=1 Tax=Pseudovirgaria hyperparasitica TaxID=470096 RepID=A0A6A6W811_9PEZI|nr:uncharacterized protein EJ05DRAFT_500682 [Pseudovirgaria hyperparasitica]KAF2758164.1 hypothetical protein EJ05DRAFT_500682 [Pseudovirgaria hyperparasitica]